MLFPTASFGLFFAVTLPLAWALRGRSRAWRWAMLGVSWLFYAGWDPRFVGLLAASMLANHGLVRWLDRQDDRRRRGALLALTVGPRSSVTFRPTPTWPRG